MGSFHNKIFIPAQILTKKDFAVVLSTQYIKIGFFRKWADNSRRHGQATSGLCFFFTLGMWGHMFISEKKVQNSASVFLEHFQIAQPLFYQVKKSSLFKTDNFLPLQELLAKNFEKKILFFDPDLQVPGQLEGFHGQERVPQNF